MVIRKVCPRCQSSWHKKERQYNDPTLEVEADAMSSFVQKKAHKQWSWLAVDAVSRQVLAFHMGDGSRTSAKPLWAKIPEAYRQARHVVHRSVCGLRRGDACGAAPSDQQVGVESQSP